MDRRRRIKKYCQRRDGEDEVVARIMTKVMKEMKVEEAKDFQGG